MSILLWYAFRGMLEHRQEAKFADFLRLWGTVMDKYIAQGGASAEAGDLRRSSALRRSAHNDEVPACGNCAPADILDHMMGYDEFRAGMLKGEFKPK